MGTYNGVNPVSVSGAQNGYDARWFVWTIVFLVVTGISLVGYIVLSDTTESDVPAFANISGHKE